MLIGGSLPGDNVELPGKWVGDNVPVTEKVSSHIFTIIPVI